LPAGAITSIVRAPDGVLWVAARDGLARLDGDRFVTVGAEAGLPQRRARQVLFDRAGGSGWPCRAATYSRADMQSPFLPVWPQGDFSGLTLAPDGTVWASDADSYYRMLPSAPPPTQRHGRRSAAAICITTAMAPCGCSARRAGTAQRQHAPAARRSSRT
jgi:streptogramin lyase